VLLAAALVAVAATLGIAFAVMESPAEARARKIDQRRIEDLRALATTVSRYSEENDGALPPDLQTAVDSTGFEVRLHDPVTGEPYSYRPLDDRHIELCATFESAEPPEGRRWTRVDDHWSHPAGDHCWTLTRETEDAGDGPWF